MIELSVSQMLGKANSGLKKGKFLEAEFLYIKVLINFPNNLKAQQGLKKLREVAGGSLIETPPKELTDKLIDLVNEEKFELVLKQVNNFLVYYPKATILWNILGIASGQLEKFDQAAEAFEKSITLAPNQASAYYNLGNVYRERGQIKEALEAYTNALKLMPNHKDAYRNLAVLLEDQSKLKAIKQSDVIELRHKKPSTPEKYAEQYVNAGLELHQTGEFDDAIKVYREALKFSPENAEAYNMIAVAFKHQGLMEEAIDHYKKAISFKPDYSEAYHNMGIALKEQGKIDEAINAYKEAINLKPNYANAYNSLGVALCQQGHGRAALQAYRKAIDIDNNHASAHKNLSYVLFDIGQINEALEQYEWRWFTSEFSKQKRDFAQPVWHGELDVKNKTLLCWSEQGIGDTIAWSWSLLYLASHVKKCVLECPKKLVPLLDRSLPNVEVRPENREKDSSRDDFDIHIPMGSTFRILNQSMSITSKLDVFLKPDKERVEYWKARLQQLGSGPFVGISWKSAQINNRRRENYTEVEDWAPIFKHKDAVFINLQYKDFETDISTIQSTFGIVVHNFAELDHFNNLCDVAALCAALDIVVTVKNTVSLIAAGVGTQTTLLNWKQSDWNNVLHNPAGPRVKIFERSSGESWKNVMQLATKHIQNYLN